MLAKCGPAQQFTFQSGILKNLKKIQLENIFLQIYTIQKRFNFTKITLTESTFGFILSKM